MSYETFVISYWLKQPLANLANTKRITYFQWKKNDDFSRTQGVPLMTNIFSAYSLAKIQPCSVSSLQISKMDFR